MNIALINFNDISGGATRAAIRQYQALLTNGIATSFHVLAKQSQSPNITAFDYRTGWLKRIMRRLYKNWIEKDIKKYDQSRPDGFELFSDDRVHLGRSVFRNVEKFDVANLHWVAGYCDFRSSFKYLLDAMPVVWTLHDQNPFTGGCHYSHDCDRFVFNCGCCPQLGSASEDDLSFRVWERKKKALRNRSTAYPFCVVTPSRWLAKEALHSSLFRQERIEVVPYGLDTDIYRPVDRMVFRKKYDLSESDPVILFIASGAGARRKGFSFLDKAVSSLSDRGALTIITGGGKKPVSSGLYRHIHLGTISEETVLAAVYSMADLFVIPSVEDNLPLACQEALACGTPAIGFEVGGIPDMVIEGKTGMLVPPRDVPALSRAIEAFFADPELAKRLSVGARDHAVHHYSYSRNAEAYRTLYESMIQG